MLANDLLIDALACFDPFAARAHYRRLMGAAAPAVVESRGFVPGMSRPR